MAITIETSPQLFTPSDNPVVWTFSSTNTGQQNFSFIVELYIDSALDSSHQLFPESLNYAHYDASEILRARVQQAVKSQSTLIVPANNTRLVSIKVIERYGSPVENEAELSSTNIYAFKARLSKPEYVAFDYNTFKTTSFGCKFLTDSPIRQTIKADSDYFLQIITNLATNNELRLSFYNGASLIENQTVSIPAALISKFNFSFENLLSSTTVLQSTLDNMTHFLISIRVLGFTLSEVRRIDIDRSTCDIPSQLIWLQKYGAYDQFIFTHNKTFSASISQQGYSKQFGEWVGTSFTFDSNNSGNISYKKTIKKSIEVSSGWLLQAVQNWLVQLYESPLTYIGSDRVTVNNNSYDVKQTQHDELFNEIVTIQVPNDIESLII
jgi:hypothetical protein